MSAYLLSQALAGNSQDSGLSDSYGPPADSYGPPEDSYGAPGVRELID